MDRRRIAHFLRVAFGISGAVALAIHLAGGLTDSPAVLPGTPVTLVVDLLATDYM